jgi:hypothetical protein
MLIPGGDFALFVLANLLKRLNVCMLIYAA